MTSVRANNLRKPRRRTRRSRGLITRAVSIFSVLGFLGMVIWFFLQAGTFGKIWTPDKGAQEAALPQAEKSDVAAAVFSGFDGEKDPYTINADSAQQDAQNPAKTHLDTVRGRLHTSSKNELLHMKSDKGLYNSNTKLLDLEGNVEIVSSDNYVAYMPTAQIDVNAKRLASDDPIHVIFDQGTIDADAVEMWDNGNTILFKNGVKMRIDPRSGSGKENSQ
ncbi:MAG: LPS export ABC transporter periplasmic protein LptC [Hyphomicrobiales bacterium]